jgi:hypothetical protein
MTQELYQYLNDILADLKTLSSELDTAIEDPEMASDLADELTDKVTASLTESIDWLDEILEKVDKTDDLDYFSDEDEL